MSTGKATEGHWTQCLLFIVHKTRDDVGKAASLLEPAKLTGYVLLPSSVELNPWKKVTQVLLANEIRSINEEGFRPPLINALKSKRVEVIDILLDKSAEAEVIGPLGYFPLQMCIENGNETVVKLIFKTRSYVRALPKLAFFKIHQPCFDEANLKILERVLRYNVDISFRQPESGTILHYAITKDNQVLLKLLLTHGINTAAERTDGLTALDLATINGQAHNVETLLKEGVDVKTTIRTTLKGGSVPLHTAVLERYSAVIKLLLNAGVSVDSIDKKGQTILQIAVKKGYPEIVESILRHCPDLKSKRNKSSFNFAVSRKEEEFVKVSQKLLKYGFSKNLKAGDAKNSRFIHDTVRKNFTETMRDLLKMGANVECRKDYEVRRKDDTPLMTAVRYADAEMMQLLIDHGANVNILCGEMKSPLLVAVENSNIPAIKVLLANGAKFGSPEYMHTAAAKGCLEAVEIFVQNGANVNGVLNKKTLLFEAAGKGFLNVTKLKPQEVIALLVKLGADVNVKCIDGDTPLITAVKHDNVPAVTQLLASGVDYQDSELLMIASKFNASEAIKLLVKNGAKVNAINEGSTALHAAVESGNEASTDVLLELGAIIDLKNNKGMTSLHVAADRGYFRIMETLLKNGANPNVKSHDERMPLWTALEKGFPDVVRTLLMYGADLGTARQSVTALRNAIMGGDSILKIFLEFASTDLHVSNRNFTLLIDTKYSFCWKNQVGIFARHLMKMLSAELFVGDEYVPMSECWDKYNLDTFFDECKDELSNLKRTKIGNTSVSFYDILRQDTCKIACYSRNENISMALNSSDYRRSFKKYGCMIYYNYLKGVCRKELSQQAIDRCNAQIFGFSSLPRDIQETIIHLLSLEDLRNLTNACRTRALDVAEST